MGAAVGDGPSARQNAVILGCGDPAQIGAHGIKPGQRDPVGLDLSAFDDEVPARGQQQFHLRFQRCEDGFRQFDFRHAFGNKVAVAGAGAFELDLQLSARGEDQRHRTLSSDTGERAGAADDLEDIRVEPGRGGEAGVTVGVEAEVDAFDEAFLKRRPAEGPAQGLLGLARADGKGDGGVEDGVFRGKGVFCGPGRCGGVGLLRQCGACQGGRQQRYQAKAERACHQPVAQPGVPGVATGLMRKRHADVVLGEVGGVEGCHQ